MKDVDFATNQLMIRDGKGRKDRVTMLPAAVKAALAAHIERVRQQHQADLRPGAGWVELPGALVRKYPTAGLEWGWQWVFPATRFYVDRVSGQRRRHHLHESVLQKAVKDAVRAAGIAKLAALQDASTKILQACYLVERSWSGSSDANYKRILESAGGLTLPEEVGLRRLLGEGQTLEGDLEQTSLTTKSRSESQRKPIEG